MHFSEGKVMVTSRRKRSADQAPNGINGGGVAGPFMPAWCLICAALSARLSPARPTKSLDLSLTLTNNVIHVNDVPEHLLTMYPVCTGSASLPAPAEWLGPIISTVHTNDSTLTRNKRPSCQSSFRTLLGQ